MHLLSLKLSQFASDYTKMTNQEIKQFNQDSLSVALSRPIQSQFSYVAVMFQQRTQVRIHSNPSNLR